MKLLCRCPHCNGFFTPADYSQTGVICRWCGNDVGVAEYVEADADEKEVLDKIFANREEVETALGLSFNTRRALGPASVAIIPVVIVGYKLFAGLSVAWYLWILGVLGAIYMLSLPFAMRKERKIIDYIKNLAAQKNYSFEALQAEIPVLKAKSEQIEKESIYSSKVRLLADVAEAISKLIPYAYSKISVREGYAKGESRGVIHSTLSPGVTVSSHASQTERVVYIVPPHNCPACNYVYKTHEMDDSTIVCPHCSFEIDLVDKSVRTQTQAMIHDFFLGNNKMQVNSTSKMFMWFGIVMLTIAVVVMLFQGIERFFFSWSFLLLFMGCSFLVFSISGFENQRALKKRVEDGLKNLFEIEMYVREHLSVEMGEDFYKLKEEIIRNLKK